MDQVVVAHLSDLHCRPRLQGGRIGFPLLFSLALSNALEDARVLTELPDEEPIHMAVTGDLTNRGDFGEFVAAHTLLRSRVRLRLLAPKRQVGFMTPDDQIVSIPGNHDHWRGRMWIASPSYSPKDIEDHFSVTPWCHAWQSRSERLRVSLFGVDSASGLRGAGPTNLPGMGRPNHLATGRISDPEFAELEVLLDGDRRRSDGVVTVRAILCHHSLAYVDPYFGHFNQLDTASRDRLIALARDFDVWTILTGHTHDFYFPAHLRRPVELRSSSFATDPNGEYPTCNERPGFWLHRVRLIESTPAWQAWRYAWTGRDFVRSALAPCVDLS